LDNIFYQTYSKLLTTILDSVIAFLSADCMMMQIKDYLSNLSYLLCNMMGNEMLTEFAIFILCCIVLKPAINLVCDPHYLNSKLYGWLSYKERLVAKAKRKYLYAATYEDFMEMIEHCEDIEQLKHIRFIYGVQA